MLGGLEETLQGIDVVKGYVREGYERKRMWTLERGMMKQQMKMGLDRGHGVAADGSCRRESWLRWRVVWLARQTFSGELSTSNFLVMVALLAGMLDPVRKIANVYKHRATQRGGVFTDLRLSGRAG